jgi:hypothetical protein
LTHTEAGRARFIRLDRSNGAREPSLVSSETYYGETL